MSICNQPFKDTMSELCAVAIVRFALCIVFAIATIAVITYILSQAEM